jgi:hypothetical protein
MFLSSMAVLGVIHRTLVGCRRPLATRFNLITPSPSLPDPILPLPDAILLRSSLFFRMTA